MAGHLASVLIEKATHRQAECGTIKRPKQFLSLFLEQLQATRLVQSSNVMLLLSRMNKWGVIEVVLSKLRGQKERECAQKKGGGEEVKLTAT
jgi:hypothetical protein